MVFGSEGITVAMLRSLAQFRWTWRVELVTKGTVPYLTQKNPTLAKFGFGYSRVTDAYWYVDFPHWFIAAMTSLLPGGWLIRRVAIRRQRGAGRCLCCGYDLRGTPDRCPECGAVPEPRARTAA
jgi:hypothetical protein